MINFIERSSEVSNAACENVFAVKIENFSDFGSLPILLPFKFVDRNSEIIVIPVRIALHK